MNDFAVKLDLARAKLPLRLLMEQRGRTPGKKCPYCGQDGGGLYKPKGENVECFKCHYTSCPSNTSGKGESWDQVRFLMHELGLPWKDAAITLMKEALVWEEAERTSPSTLPGASRRKRAVPTEGNEGGVPEELVQECIAVIVAEQKASIALLQRRCQLGWARASQVMAELEKRGLVGPALANEPRKILMIPGAASSGASVAPTVEAPAALAAPLPTTTPQVPEAPVGAATNGSNGTDGKAAEGGLEPQAAAQSSPPESAAKQGGDEGSGPVPEAKAAGTEPNGQEPATKGTEPEGSKVVDMRGRPVAVQGEPEAETGNETSPPLPLGLAALREFYAAQALSEQDEAELFYKRGLESATSLALGYASNPKSNRDLLMELADRHGFEEMAAAGLWLERDRRMKKERRPNSQFCGLGIAGKKTAEELKGEESEAGEFKWGWVYPVLIPYFNERGELVGLRPHKGMGRSGTIVGTPRVYVPRDFRRLQAAPKLRETFSTVVITEGEFKAAALWQTLGVPSVEAGVRSEAIGVCALPGISFGKNYEVREVLDDWLWQVKCRRVIVAFDNEEKGDPKLASYKADHRKRFDAQIWARFLATDLAQKLHIHGEVCVLPTEWRNSKGKADWDGALAEVVSGEARKQKAVRA